MFSASCFSAKAAQIKTGEIVTEKDKYADKYTNGNRNKSIKRK